MVSQRDEAPDFTLPADDDRMVSLKDSIGKRARFRLFEKKPGCWFAIAVRGREQVNAIASMHRHQLKEIAHALSLKKVSL